MLSRAVARSVPFLLLLLLWPLALQASPELFRPDPAAVQWDGAAYRYPQAGWWVVHIEGAAYERGVQHGRLMSAEIAAYIRCFAADYSDRAPADAWRLLRLVTGALFLSRFEREYLEEMRGIADGAAAAGARFDGRPVDLTDIATLNLWPEIMTIPGATEALPTGLEGIKFPAGSPRSSTEDEPGRCSAFVATAPATADGKIVFGHISMFDLYPSTFFNVWLDVKPSRGHRVLMQTVPGGISSGMDYYLNDAGILVSETTIRQTRLDAAGTPQAGRIRKALQYSETIDQVVEILRAGNNGLYTNEWLLADIKSNEIAMFELGTRASKLYRSGRGEWFGGTPGFYWGCNNAKDLEVRLETIAATGDRPANLVWRPSDRDAAWIDIYRRHQGKIDAGFAREAFTSPPICAFASLDAKFTSSDLAGKMSTWALFGPPRGKTWTPTDEEKRKYSEVEPMVSNPWTLLQVEPPAPPVVAARPVDQREKEHETDSGDVERDGERRRGSANPLVWRGTLLPRSDGDIWLAAAFADFHRIVAREKAPADARPGDEARARHRNEFGTSLYAAKAQYLPAAAAAGDVPLAGLHAEVASRDWYRIAAGKGVLVLNELRARLGDEKFVEALDSFGAAHAGAPVSWPEFAAHVAEKSGEKLDDFFAYWVQGKGLPRLQLTGVEMEAGAAGGPYRLRGVVGAAGGPLPAHLEVTVEDSKDETTRSVTLEPSGAFHLEVERAPKRLVVDKYGRTAKANGGSFDIASVFAAPERALIVYGTLDDEAGDREAAEVLQENIRRAHSNFVVPVVSDAAVHDAELRGHDLLLIGRPQANRLTQRFHAAVPVDFGPQSFRVCGDLYAHPRTAVIAAGANPADPRCSITVVAGLSAAATYRAVSQLDPEDAGAEVEVLPHGGRARKLVVPAPELVHDFPAAPPGTKASGN